MKLLGNTIRAISVTLLLLACLQGVINCDRRHGNTADGKRISLIAGEEIPKATVVKTLYDDGYWAVFFELPATEAEALWQRVAARLKPQPFDTLFTYGIGDEELNGLSGSHVLLPSAGDGSCRYLLRLDNQNTFVAVRACYGI